MRFRTVQSRWSLMGLFVVAIVLGRSLLLWQLAERPAVRANDEVKPSGAQAIARVMDVQNRWTDRLMAQKGVVGTATGVDSAGRPLVLVLTERAVVDGLPKTVDGVPVKIQVTGRLFAKQTVRTTTADNPQNGEGRAGDGSSTDADRAAGDTGSTKRSIPIGVSTANAKQCSSGGTIACRVVDSDGKRYALSNNHVYALGNTATPGDDILYPGPGRPIEQNETIASLSKFIKIDMDGDNRVDAAIAEIRNGSLGVATPSDGYGTPSSQTVSATTLQCVQKYGGTTGLTRGQVIGVNATVHVAYSGGMARFVDQILVKGRRAGFFKSGDSGALLVSEDSNRPVGLLFAGSLGGRFAVANPIDTVLEQLGVTIDDGSGRTPETRTANSIYQPAFPGAEGYAATATGGRWGRVIEVTNRNDSGPGSLRAAVEASGRRIVVFKVGGTILLESGLEIGNPHITIAGQTAPGDGVTLQFAASSNEQLNSLLSVRTRNVVLRYLRLRRGESGGAGDSLTIHDGSSSVIVDHTSITWATDENLDIYSGQGGRIRDVTIQNSLIAEAFDTGNGSALGVLISGSKDPEHWRAVSRIDLHHNVMVHNTHRNPRVITRGTKIVNNIVYNWASRAGSTERDTLIDWIGNYFIRGPMSNLDNERLLFHATTSPDLSVTYPAASIYIARNIAPDFGFTSPLQDNWPMLKDHYVKQDGRRLDVPESMRRPAPLQNPPIPVAVSNPGRSWKDSLLSDVGAHRKLDASGNWADACDPIDRRILGDVAKGTGPRYDSLPSSAVGASGGYSPRAVDGGYADADVDGMPDVWENAHGFNKCDSSDGSTDADNDGWTNVEEFLNGTNPHAPSQISSRTIDRPRSVLYHKLLICLEGKSG